MENGGRKVLICPYVWGVEKEKFLIAPVIYLKLVLFISFDIILMEI